MPLHGKGNSSISFHLTTGAYSHTKVPCWEMLLICT